jgi:hypothetical protein
MAVKGKNDIRGSEDARAINRGMKQKDVDDSLLSVGLTVAGFIGFLVWVGTGSFILGGVVFFILFSALGYWYFKE